MTYTAMKKKCAHILIVIALIGLLSYFIPFLWKPMISRQDFTRTILHVVCRRASLLRANFGETPVEYDPLSLPSIPAIGRRVTDSWGKQVRVWRSRSEIMAQSSGPDRKWDTEDDISVRFESGAWDE